MILVGVLNAPYQVLGFTRAAGPRLTRADHQSIRPGVSSTLPTWPEFRQPPSLFARSNSPDVNLDRLFRGAGCITSQNCIYQGAEMSDSLERGRCPTRATRLITTCVT